MKLICYLRIYPFLILFIFSGFSINAQYFPKKQINKQIEKQTSDFGIMKIEENPLKKVNLKSYILRKSVGNYFSDKNSKLAKKGALFALTKPKGKQTSVAINGGLILSFSKTIINVKDSLIKYIRSSAAPYIQFDKNTLIDKEQSNLLMGINYTNNLIDYNKFKNKYGERKRKFNAPLKILGSYRKDYENNLEAFQSSLIFLPRMIKINDKQELTRVNWFGNRSVIDFDVNLGLEYDYRFNSNIKTLEGNLLRTYALTKIQLKASKRFIATLDWHYRYILANSTSLVNSDFSLLTFKIDYKPKFATDKNIFESIEPTIGIVYENGENPVNGFNDQSYWALVLSLKI